MDSTNAQRQRRYIERLKERAGGASEVAALKVELATARSEVAALKAKLATAPAASQPKTTVPPDEARDRRMKGLTTEIKNLKAKITAMWRVDQQMSFELMSAIAKCIHPDHTPTNAERDAACRMFTAWKADTKEARKLAQV